MSDKTALEQWVKLCDQLIDTLVSMKDLQTARLGEDRTDVETVRGNDFAQSFRLTKINDAVRSLPKVAIKYGVKWPPHFSMRYDHWDSDDFNALDKLYIDAIRLRQLINDDLKS